MRSIGFCLTMTFFAAVSPADVRAQQPVLPDISTDDEISEDSFAGSLIEQAETPQQIKVVRLRTLHPTLAANTLVELFPDRAEVLHIAAQAELNAIVLRGPEAMVMECVTLVHELDEASAGERANAENRKPIVAEAPIAESFNQGSQKLAVRRVYGVEGRPVQWAEAKTPEMAVITQHHTIAQELQTAESAEHQRRLGELGTKYKALEKVGKHNEAESVKNQIRELIEEAHEARQQHQQQQIEQFEKRLEALKRRLEERESQRDEIIGDAVEAILTGVAMKARHTDAVSYWQPLQPAEFDRDDLQRHELALRATELARNKSMAVRLEQESKLRALELEQAKIDLREVAEKVNRVRKARSTDAISQRVLENAEEQAVAAAIQLERAKVAFEMAQKQLKIYRQEAEAQPSN